MNLSLNSASLRGLIEQFVDGTDALNKAISLRAISCSKEFRQGIIDGLYTTDGSKNTGGGSNRIYTSSEALKDTLVALCASLGIATTINIDTREGRLGTNPCYTIRYYTPNGRTHRKDIYIIDACPMLPMTLLSFCLMPVMRQPKQRKKEVIND